MIDGRTLAGEVRRDGSTSATAMIVQMTRFVFFVAGALAGFWVARAANWTEQIGYSEYYIVFIFIVLGGAIGFVLGGILGRELSAAYSRLEERLRNVSAAELALGATGLMVGLLLALSLSLPLRSVQPVFIGTGAMLVALILGGSLGLRVALLKRDDVEHAFPKLAAGRSRGHLGDGRVMYLDTSAVIDGRFAQLRRAGFMDGQVLVPRFVLGELQALADSEEDTRRVRGRRGLDLLTSMRESDSRVSVYEIDYPQIADVDDKLMRLAEDAGGVVVTVDHNLTSTARVKGVGILNVNELAAALRPAFLPGERLEIRVLREGKESEQGVGYLEDGTMVVVQGGRPHVGSSVEVEVTSVLQTSVGRMIFAKLSTET